jgi:nucleotide-binding universal stress UspA family protein
MIKKILLGYDGSASADKALAFALDLAKHYNAELHLLAVARPPEFGTEVETEAEIENSRHDCHRVLAPAKTRLAGETVQTSYRIAVGHPAEQIVRYAEEDAVDHIVVGHLGHMLFERWLLGSVARHVIAYAPCAVTVVR